jgi:cyclopropane fatty-acyl-phospholipid synthase-like methyltransferase
VRPHHLPSTRPEDLYRSQPPWDIGRPQAVFQALADAGMIGGRVLDVGCGSGEHALMCAALGFEVTGVDLAANALQIARRKADERELTVRFLQLDARNLGELGESFDTLLDCGLFHIFDPNTRPAYVAGLAAAARPGTRCFLLCFSDQQPGDRGPHRIARSEIAAAFADGWRIDAIEPAAIEVTTDPGGIRAWSAPSEGSRSHADR